MTGIEKMLMTITILKRERERERAVLSNYIIEMWQKKGGKLERN
jgi:hypothetical protein